MFHEKLYKIQNSLCIKFYWNADIFIYIYLCITHVEYHIYLYIIHGFSCTIMSELSDCNVTKWPADPF
jgi:hypothetical protein